MSTFYPEVRHPQVPWVLCARYVGYEQAIGVPYRCRCEVCGAVADPVNLVLADQFAAAHRVHRSVAPSHYGAGDVVAAVTKAIGIKRPCTPCEQRRHALNNWLPRLWGK